MARRSASREPTTAQRSARRARRPGTEPTRPPASHARPAASPTRWLAPLAVALTAFAVYANSLGNGFVWDDPIILERQLVVFRTAGDVLLPPRDIPQFSPDYYRPLTIATYLVDHAVGGGSPFPFHLSVVLAHVAAALLVWALAAQLLASAPGAAAGALVAGLLFAVHPIHTESVAWAAGRSDVLATLFLLAALVAHARAPWTWARSALVGVAAALALGAKEIGVALVPLLVLYDLLVPPRRRPVTEWVRGYAGVAVAALVYVALRRAALGETIGTASGVEPVQRSLLELLAALGTYVRLLLWPWPLNAYIDVLPVTPLSLAAAGVFLAALAAATWQWWRTRGGVPLFALLWIALTLVPSLAILWKIPDAPLAERYCYLPSAGACLLAGVLVARVAAQSRVAARACAGGAAVVLVAGAAATVARNPVWHDDLALWQDTAAKSITSGMAARSLGTAYQRAGRADEARGAFARALALRNDARGLQTIHNNLGTLAMMDGDWAGAQRAYEQALAAVPDAPDTLFNYGLAIFHAGDGTAAAARAALPHLERARQLNPHDADIEAGLGQLWLALGDPARARTHLERALTLHPTERTAAGVRVLLEQSREH